MEYSNGILTEYEWDDYGIYTPVSVAIESSPVNGGFNVKIICK